MSYCFTCKSKDSLYHDRIFGKWRCMFCSSTNYVYVCHGCDVTFQPVEGILCENCVDSRLETATLTDPTITPEPPAPKPVKRTPVRLTDKFKGKPRVARTDKHADLKKGNRRNRAARDKFRRIKMGYDERTDLGEVDPDGNFYTAYRMYKWSEQFAVVELTKTERENANRTNGHLIPTDKACKCIKFMWSHTFNGLKAGRMEGATSCPHCKTFYQMDEHGQTVFSHMYEEEHPVVYV